MRSYPPEDGANPISNHRFDNGKALGLPCSYVFWLMRLVQRCFCFLQAAEQVSAVDRFDLNGVLQTAQGNVQNPFVSR